MGHMQQYLSKGLSLYKKVIIGSMPVSPQITWDVLYSTSDLGVSKILILSQVQKQYKPLLNISKQ